MNTPQIDNYYIFGNMDNIDKTFLYWLVAQIEVNTYATLCFGNCQVHKNGRKTT